MNFLFYLGHPAHFHLFKNVILKLKEREHKILITAKNKDVLHDLLDSSGFSFINILSDSQNKGFTSIITSTIEKANNLTRIIKKFKPNLMIGTSAEIGLVGKRHGIKSIFVTEDDWDADPLLSFFTFPFASAILAPKSCRVAIWGYKRISYSGYHELAYLSPQYFKPNRSKVEKLFKNKQKYFLIRLASLTAHHDIGMEGLTERLVTNIINILEPYGDIYIISERPLEKSLQSYRIQIPPEDIHHALYYADLYLGDSQTMAAEAAILGTPSIRYNDFVNKIGYLDELEFKYKLTFGIPTHKTSDLYSKIKNIVKQDQNQSTQEKRLKKMLDEQIDIVDFFVKQFENFK
tara:strand:+ start:689 stop:1732 length:1044 start_codon:yes stop_codon:yes gene_type:complete